MATAVAIRINSSDTLKLTLQIISIAAWAFKMIVF